MKRTSSSACRLAGSEIATKSLLLRLYSGRTRRVCAILRSTNSFWIWSRSKLARSSSGVPNVRDANTASCCGGHPLAEQHLLDERHAGRLRLRLQRFGLVLGHEAVLRERARESADVAGGGVRGHGGRRDVRSVVGVGTGEFKRKQAPCRIARTQRYSIRIKLSWSMMPARPAFVKAGRPGRPGRSSLTTFTARSWVCRISISCPSSRNDGPGLRNVAQMLEDEPIERFRAVQRELGAQPAVQRPQQRHAGDDDAAVGLAPVDLGAAGGLGRELADDLLDDVLDRDQALELAVFVDDQPQPLAVVLELRQLRQQRRARRE